jgi:predicted phosphoadenosine phosphosulfate sulfurtransferase
MSHGSGSYQRRGNLTTNVYEEALSRLVGLYAAGERVVVAFSAGKDSGVCLELCIEAARITGRLPVDVVMRDEEIMFPGTFEYAERVANRPEVNFKWLVAHQPIINCFNRAEPYFWAFDPLLPPDKWVRTPPPFAEEMGVMHIETMVHPDRFPIESGQTLFSVVGLRVQESRNRLYSIFSSRGHLTKPNAYGVRNCRPIYDWKHGDVWKAIHEKGWDYNRAYDVMLRFGVKQYAMRIGPPTLNPLGARILKPAASAWPRWFDKVCDRLPGVRQVALFGLRVVQPDRRQGEHWQQTFQRECIDNAPGWIAERAVAYSNAILKAHSKHSTGPLPEKIPCRIHKGNIGSWRALTHALYNGDPFALRTDLPVIEPEFFRQGAGTWGGKPTF